MCDESYAWALSQFLSGRVGVGDILWTLGIICQYVRLCRMLSMLQYEHRSCLVFNSNMHTFVNNLGMYIK